MQKSGIRIAFFFISVVESLIKDYSEYVVSSQIELFYENLLTISW